jgi:riboflavin kinase / FMN adenylyltransferase
MNLFLNLEEASQSSAIKEVCLGFFDGLHLGHREVILGKDSPMPEVGKAVISFQQHPQSVLRKDHPIPLITGLPHKIKILQSWNIQHLFLLPFTRELSQKPAEIFLEELLLHLPHMQKLRVGENFRFGYLRQGNPDLLRAWGKRQGISIEIVSSVLSGDLPISSSRIRHDLNHRHLTQAAILLGRRYSLYGKVSRGQQLGSALGFPTANLISEDGCLLPKGVYQGRAYLDDGSTFTAAINIGTRPTITVENKLSIEAYLLDYAGNLYDRDLNLEIHAFLREEKTFSSKEELIQQLHRDVESVRRLSEVPPNP